MKAFIFDMDGVIIDSEPIHTAVMKQELADFPFTLTQEECDRYTGMTCTAVFADIIEKYHLPYTAQQMAASHMNTFKQYVLQNHVEPMAGIVPLLEQLHRRQIPAAIASSSPLDAIEAVADDFQIRRYYKFFVSGESLPHGKPYPDIYLKTAELLGIAPADCVVLEDSCNGVRAAKDAGMYCIGFVNPNSGKQDLSRADEIVTDIASIDLDRYF